MTARTDGRASMAEQVDAKPMMARPIWMRSYGVQIPVGSSGVENKLSAHPVTSSDNTCEVGGLKYTAS